MYIYSTLIRKLAKNFYRYFLRFMVFSATSNQLQATIQHQGWKLEFGTGIYGVLEAIEGEDKKFGPVIETGLGYFKAFGRQQKMEWNLAIFFHAFIPGCLTPVPIVLLGPNIKVSPIYIPLTHCMLGYNISTKNQLSLGITYLWGPTIRYQYLFSEKIYGCFKLVWWADRVFYERARGLHDFYTTICLGYKF